LLSGAIEQDADVVLFFQPSGKTTAENAADGFVFLRSGSAEALHENAKAPEKHGKSLINRLPGQDLNLE